MYVCSGWWKVGWEHDLILLCVFAGLSTWHILQLLFKRDFTNLSLLIHFSFLHMLLLTVHLLHLQKLNYAFYASHVPWSSPMAKRCWILSVIKIWLLSGSQHVSSGRNMRSSQDSHSEIWITLKSDGNPHSQLRGHIAFRRRLNSEPIISPCGIHSLCLNNILRWIPVYREGDCASLSPTRSELCNDPQLNKQL